MLRNSKLAEQVTVIAPALASQPTPVDSEIGPVTRSQAGGTRARCRAVLAHADSGAVPGHAQR